MPANEANPIYLSERERRDLEALVCQQTCAQQVALRARIVLLASEGVGIQPSATRLGIARTTVRSWRRRWLASTDNRVAERLADAPRPGTPATYSAEDACAILALACEDPCDSGRAITHWTQRELAAEAIKRGIVPAISALGWAHFKKMSTSNPIVCAGGSTPSPIRSSPRSAMTFAGPIGSPPSVPPLLVSQPISIDEMTGV